MDFLENIWNKAKNAEKTIVLPETRDPRVLKAAELILISKIAKIILVGNKETIERSAAENNLNISKAEIINPALHPKIGRYVELYMNNMKARKHPVSFNDAKALLESDYPYFGAMMTADGDADGMVTGADHPTAHTIKAALYSVGLKENTSVLSSFFAMIAPNKQFGANGVLFFADCAVVPSPDKEQLCEIALQTAESFMRLTGKEPRIAMLSFSTKGSGRSSESEKVAAAARLAKEKAPELLLDGEMQADSALIPAIGKIKAPDSRVAGRANTLIFPDLNSGNIAYKLVRHLAGAAAIGPIFQGCKKPINDLSRGCSVEDIVNVAAITAMQA